MVRDFPVTVVHACVCRDVEQAGCVTFQSQLRMHVCDVMGSRQGARLYSHMCACMCVT